jgi:tetratricopeptide (TPR) repeat protein
MAPRQAAALAALGALGTLACAAPRPATGADGASPPASSSPAAGTSASGADSSARPGGVSDPRVAGALAELEVGERALAAGEAAGALAAFDRAAAALGAALLYQDADPESGGEVGRRIAAGSARAYLRLGEPYLAAVEARRALNLERDDAALQAFLGTSLYRSGRFEQAEAAFAEALRLDPACAPAHAGQGLLELSANHLASARERLDRAYRLDGDPAHLLLLARIVWTSTSAGCESCSRSAATSCASDPACIRGSRTAKGRASRAR